MFSYRCVIYQVEPEPFWSGSRRGAPGARRIARGGATDTGAHLDPEPRGTFCGGSAGKFQKLRRQGQRVRGQDAMIRLPFGDALPIVGDFGDG